MNMRWSLDELYPSFESKEFSDDMNRCMAEVNNLKAWADKNFNDNNNIKEKLQDFIIMQNTFLDLYTRLSSFAELSLSVDAKNEQALSIIEKLEDLVTELTKPSVLFQKWVSSIDNLESIITSSEILKEHQYYLFEIIKNNKYLLSEEEEMIIAKMKITGSNSWTKLQELLTSTLLVEIEIDGEEKKLPLPVIRNMAYDSDKKIRKKAYEAELKSYKKIEESIAASLNGIKGEVLTLTKMRGYDSPLEKTLIDSRMNKETLDAMFEAIKESLPYFQLFYRKKAELLGHNNGLPFYDLFAPIGEVNLTYSYDESKEFIVEKFKSYSDKLANFANNAFLKNWIDAEPREGKRGGAFCANLHSIKESRILSNFAGSFNDVITLAHELGHGYHGSCLYDETYLNSGYPMPLAETASIFCETIIKNAAIQEASKEETLVILENDISDAGQVIVDIYSRYLFETELFNLRKDGSLSVETLKKIMLNAQREAYSDGLDEQYLHPYMWLCKPHYYSAESNFYNFPYAFGLLFAKGLYAEYLKRGESFINEYDQLLSVTGKLDIADVAKIMGIDVTAKDFWRSSLQLIEHDIELFISMT